MSDLIKEEQTLQPAPLLLGSSPSAIALLETLDAVEARIAHDAAVESSAA